MSSSPWKKTRKRILAWTERAQALYQRAGKPGYDFFHIVFLSVKRFSEMRAVESAAGLAYYALFSLFPLTLILISLAGYLFGSEMAYIQVFAFLRSTLPFAGDLLDKNLQEVVDLRGPVGVAGVLGMLWSATGFFSLLAYSINRAWPMVKLRSLVHNRLVALAMIAGLFALLLLSLISSALINLLPDLRRLFDTNGPLASPGPWTALLRLVPALFTLLMFILLYRRVPNKNVAWGAVLPGALFTTLIWELGKFVFAVYLGSGLVRYELIYGSLGALIALMLWIFFANLITLFGAYLAASIDQWIDLRRTASQPAPASQPVGKAQAPVGDAPIPATSAARGNGHQIGEPGPADASPSPASAGPLPGAAGPRAGAAAAAVYPHPEPEPRHPRRVRG